MDRDALWHLFEKTGNIGAYMLYCGTETGDVLNNQGAAINADENRRADNTGLKCR